MTEASKIQSQEYKFTFGLHKRYKYSYGVIFNYKLSALPFALEANKTDYAYLFSFSPFHSVLSDRPTDLLVTTGLKPILFKNNSPPDVSNRKFKPSLISPVHSHYRTFNQLIYCSCVK